MIFYFSATGNSIYLAKAIAAQTGDALVDIAACVREKRYDFALADGEAVGFVVPVYYLGIPMIVAEFLEHFHASAAYSYVVLNCGGFTANAGKFFRVNAEFGIKTVDNYVPAFKAATPETVEKQLAAADAALVQIISHIQKRDAGRYNPHRGWFPRMITALAYPLYRRGRKTAPFTVNDACTTCGLCETICPRRAIRLESRKPVWVLAQCELCLACLNRCPAAAINYGKKTARNGRYKNPRLFP